MVFTNVCDGLTGGNFWTDLDAKPTSSLAYKKNIAHSSGWSRMTAITTFVNDIFDDLSAYVGLLT